MRIINLFLVFLLLLGVVVAYTPPGDINGRGVYKIYNFTNITADEFYGDLTGASNSSTYWDGETSQSDLNVNSSTFWGSVNSFFSRWFYDDSNILKFNETLMNSTIDTKISDNNNSLNATYVTHTEQESNNNSVVSYVDSQDGYYNESAGNYTDRAIEDNNVSVNSYINNRFNTNNVSLIYYIDQRDNSTNDSVVSYIDGKFIDNNNTLLNYIDVRDNSTNDSMKTYVDNRFTENNVSLIAYIDSENTGQNVTLIAYIDSQDDLVNASARSYTDSNNDSMKIYVDAENNNQNTTLINYIDSRDNSTNDSVVSYVDGRFTDNNATLISYIDSGNTAQNVTLISYIDAQDVSTNTSLKNYADNTFITQANEGELNVNDTDYLDGQDGSYYLDDTNETIRMDNIAGSSCAGTNKVSSFGADASPSCTADEDTTYTEGSNLSLDGTEFNWDSAWSESVFTKIGSNQEVTIAGENITSGTVADARIASTIARDSEVESANTSMKDYVDNQDVSANTSLKNYVDNTFITQANEGNLNVNGTDYWDSLDTPADINAGDITDDGTYIQNGTIWSKEGTDVYYDGGNVGIGTTAPSNLLTIQAASGSNADIRLLADADEDSQDDWRITADGGGLKFQDTYGRYPLYLGYNAGVEVRVGTGAGYDFQVENTDGDRLFTVQGETGNTKIPKDNAKLYFGADDRASIYDDGTDFVFDSQENGSGDFYFKNGKVGIGLNDPNYPLDVNGVISGTLDADNITQGTLSEPRIASSIARDSELIPDTNETTRMDNIASASCGANNFVDSFGADATPSCSADSDTTYSAGSGIDISTTTFSVAGNTGLSQDADGLSLEKLGDFTVSGTGMSGGGSNVLAGEDSFDTSVTLTTNKDIVAGTGLSGGSNDVLPGSDSDVTINTDAPTSGAGNYSYWDGSAWQTREDSDTTYSASGTLLDLTTGTFSVNEGTLTDDNFCNYEGTGTQLECTNTAANILANSANIDASGNIEWEDAGSLDASGNVNSMSGSNIDSGTVAEARIDSALTRDSELAYIGNCSSSGSCSEITYLDVYNNGWVNVSSGNDICIEGDKCLSEAGTGGGDITAVRTNGNFLTGGVEGGDAELLFNSTYGDTYYYTQSAVDTEISNNNVTVIDYVDNENTVQNTTLISYIDSPSNYLTAGDYISYTGATLNVDNQAILDVSTINASQVQNFDIAGPDNYYYANIVNMSDESVTYVDGRTLYAEEGSDQEVTIAGENVTSGTVADARIDSALTRDSELASSGNLLDLTGTTYSVNEGTLTDDNFCNYEATGTQLECTNTANNILANSANIAADGTIEWEDAGSLDSSGNVNSMSGSSIDSGEVSSTYIEDKYLVNDASDSTSGTLTANSYELGDDDYIGIGSGAERINFDTAGDIEIMGADVGIGTDSPSSKLEVAGNINISSADSSIYLGDTSNRQRFFTSSDNLYIYDSSNAFFTHVNGNTGIGGDGTPDRFLDVQGNFRFDHSGVINENGIDEDFRVESDDDANMFVVDAGNNRVGIGTDSPAAELEVEGHSGNPADNSWELDDPNFVLTEGIGSYGAENMFKFHNAYDGGTDMAAITAKWWGSTQDDTTLGFATANNGVLSTQMVIQSDGDVGIGTDNPDKDLDVNGEIKISQSGSDPFTCDLHNENGCVIGHNSTANIWCGSGGC